MYKIFMSLSILPRLWCGTVIFIVGHAAHSAARHKKRKLYPLCRFLNSFAGCKLRAELCQWPGGGTGS